MTMPSITRTLWYETDDLRSTLSQAELRDKAQPLVILGEPGMGKTHLLEWLADAPGHALCSARKLINRHNPKTLLGDAQVLVIDALDEVSTRMEGEAVDLVLRRLGELDYPRFVLSCRVADWRSATAMEAIRDQYEDGNGPLELHLEPFSDDDAVSFLSNRIGPESARSVLDHFHSRGLSGFLGNPQTLELIADVAGNGPLPENRGELFERAVRILRVETRDTKADLQLAPEVALDAAGAAFAALILTGNDAIVRKAEANNGEGEISIAEIRTLPGGEHVDGVIGTRLFKAGGADRFGYWHRRIGEYLAARWMAKLADTDRKRRRVLSLFQSRGLVPTSLRGMHAWLVRDPRFAGQVIAGDPMGVVEYGDAANLTVEQGRHLLQALRALAMRVPDAIGWGAYSLQGAVQPALIGDVRALINDPGTPFGLQKLILEALGTAQITGKLESELQTLVLNQSAIFASRRRAATALSGLKHAQDWQTMLGTLLKQGDELTLRLAIEVMDEIGYEHLDDELVANLIASFAKFHSRTLGVLWGPERHLPDARIEGVLDRYIESVKTIADGNEGQVNQEVADFAYHLIARRLALGDVEPTKLWYWLQPLDSDAGGDRKTRANLAHALQENTKLRRGVLRHVLLGDPNAGTPWTQYWHLADRSAGFTPTPDDIVALLADLDPSNIQDERWRDLISLTRHDHESGAEVRAAAYPFAAGRADQVAWIDSLAEPRVYEWQIKQSQRQQERLEQLAQRHAAQRQEFTARLESIRQGDYSSVVDLAMAYLGMYGDIDDGDLPAHERIKHWLGTEIDAAARIGFEAFLGIDPPHPTAEEIATSYAHGNEWHQGYIIVAALAERYRTGVSFSDLKDERLLAGMFVLQHSKIDDHAGVNGLDKAVEDEVRARGTWVAAMRQYLEPQLELKKTYVDGLRALMHDETTAQTAADLAAEWLIRFPDLPLASEEELIDKMIRSGRFDELKLLCSVRVDVQDNARRLNWTAIGLLADFDATVARLASIPLEADLLWYVRDRANGGYRNHSSKLSPAQLEWLIASFRTLWPFAEHPNHVRTGDRNPGDASEYINYLIRSLGTDASESACAALSRLSEAITDGYTALIRSVKAEQERIQVETTYTPPTLAAINAIARDDAPSSIRDLQAFVLEELAVVQAKIKSDDAESWRGFFDDMNVPYDEERCRDHLLGLLRQGSTSLVFEPEAHVANDKEVDITCTAGQFRLPIEIKGQWHANLWQAADTQLDKLYAHDWRADGCGIYLILWFGDKQPPGKSLRRPGRGLPSPSTPEELRDMLAAGSQASREGRVSTVVLDLTRS
jgi:hypothetical protein